MFSKNHGLIRNTIATLGLDSILFKAFHTAESVNSLREHDTCCSASPCSVSCRSGLLQGKRRLAFESLEKRELLSADTDVLAQQFSQQEGASEIAVYVTTLLDTVNENDGLISLREALNYAVMEQQERGVIRFSVQGSISLNHNYDTHTNGSTLGDGLLITKPLFIDAVESGTITLNGGGTGAGGRVFTIQNSSSVSITVEMANLSIVGGRAENGGGILSGQNSRLILTDVSIRECNATNSGGGLYGSGTVEMESVVVTACTAPTGGGIGISRFGNLNATGLQLSGNAASVTGGGLSLNHSGQNTTFLKQCTISNNSSGTEGGGIHVAAGKIALTDTLLSNNIATTGNGGGIILASATAELTMTGCEIMGNEAKKGGGGLALYNSVNKAIVSTTVFSENQASEGGGTYSLGFLQAVGVTWTGNKAIDNGAGLYNSNRAELVDCVLKKNEVQYSFGGGIFNRGTLFLEGAVLEENASLNGGGGALYNERAAECSLDGCSLLNNSAVSYGAGIYNSNSGNLTLNNSIIAGNCLTTNFSDMGLGGGIYNSSSATLTSTGTLYYNNYAKNDGAAFYNMGTANFVGSVLTANRDATGKGFGQGSLGSSTFDNQTASVYGNISTTGTPAFSTLFTVYDEQGHLISMDFDRLAPTIDLGHLACGENGGSQTLTIVYQGANTIQLGSLARSGVSDTTLSDTALDSYSLSPGDSFLVSLSSLACNEPGVHALSLSWTLNDGTLFQITASCLIAKEAVQVSKQEVNLSVTENGDYTLSLTSPPEQKITVFLVADEGLLLSASSIDFTIDNWTSRTIRITPDADYLAAHPGTGTLQIRHIVSSEFVVQQTMAEASLVPGVTVTLAPYTVIEAWQTPPVSGDYLVANRAPCLDTVVNSSESVPGIISLNVSNFSSTALTLGRWRLDWGDGIVQTYVRTTPWLAAMHYYDHTGVFSPTISWFDSGANCWSNRFLLTVFSISGVASSAALPDRERDTDILLASLEDVNSLVIDDEIIESLIVSSSNEAMNTFMPLDLDSTEAVTKKRLAIFGL